MLGTVDNGFPLIARPVIQCVTVTVTLTKMMERVVLTPRSSCHTGGLQSSPSHRADLRGERGRERESLLNNRAMTMCVQRDHAGRRMRTQRGIMGVVVTELLGETFPPWGGVFDE